MSKPFDLSKAERPWQYTACEITSAMSSLNMFPSPIDPPPEGARYLSELDNWVKHAMEHLFAAIDGTNACQVEMERLRTRAYQMRLKGEISEAAMDKLFYQKKETEK